MSRHRRSWRIPAIVIAAVLVTTSLTGAALAVSTNKDLRGNRTATYCVDVDPLPTAPLGAGPWTGTLFESEVDAALTEWNSIASASNGDALALTRRSCTDPRGYKYKVEMAEVPPGYSAIFDGTTIALNEDTEWWAPSFGARPANIYILRGTIIHEIGHSFGLGHAGNQKWNLEGSNDEADIPSMRALNSPQRSEWTLTIEKDDAAGLMWAEKSNIDWWTANPGFEDNLKYWTTSGDVSVSGTSWKGSRAAYLPGAGDFVKMQQLYDPWNTNSDPDVPTEPYDGMTWWPIITIRTHYRDSGTETGGVKIRYTDKYFDYDTDDTKNNPISTGSWTATVTLRTCNNSSEDWKACAYSLPAKLLFQDAGSSSADKQNALAIKVTFVAMTTGSLHLDYSGAEGGFHP